MVLSLKEWCIRNNRVRISRVPLYLYLTGIDNLPIHLGYEGTNNDWRDSLQLFNSYNDVN